MYFTKWQGCGNDFVFVNAMEQPIEPILRHTTRLCDRHYGIGADGVIFILPSDKADLCMRIFNTDGSEAEMCGNGIRCFARWARELGLTGGADTFSVETGAGILYPEILPGGEVRVDMNRPHLAADEIPVSGLGEGPVISETIYSEILGTSFQVTCVSMGNPHCVIFVPDMANVDLARLGPALESDPHFPRKTNVEFVQKLDERTLRMRVWERGAAVTLACGTGSCATLVAAVLNRLVDREADIILDGGRLHVEWDGKPEDHVFMTGPAEKVYEGEYPLEGESK